MTSESSEILLRLRNETRDLHHQLDRHPLLQALLSPALTLVTYRTILEKFLGFYRPMERVLSTQSVWQELGIDFEARRKTKALLRDLAAVTELPMTGVDASAPDWITNAASALGTFYVLEGSTLGGQIIARRVGAHLSLTPGQGLAFFSSYGPDVRTRWQETQRALESFSRQTHLDAELIHAAQTTFARLQLWLDS